MVEGIKGFPAKLEFYGFGYGNLVLQSQVEGLPAGTIHSVSPDVSESEGCRRSKCCCIKPTGGRMRAGAEDGLTCVVGTNWVFTQERARVGGIAEYGDRERKAALCLIYRRQTPIPGSPMHKTRFTPRRNIIDSAQSKAMANITGGSLLGCEIGVVLRSGRLEHWGTEVGGVAEVLRKCVVGEEGPTASEPPPDVSVTSVVPALRGIL